MFRYCLQFPFTLPHTHTDEDAQLLLVSDLGKTGLGLCTTLGFTRLKNRLLGM